MNDIFKTNIKTKLEKALESEKMAVSEAARNIGCLPQYLSMIRNEKFWDKCGAKAWEAVSAWVNSGQTLKEYGEKHGKVLPVKPNVVISREISRRPADKTNGENKEPAPDPGPGNKEKTENKVKEFLTENGEKTSVCLADIGWIIGMSENGHNVEKIAKKLKIYPPIVNAIVNHDTRQKLEPVLSEAPGSFDLLIGALKSIPENVSIKICINEKV